MNGFETKYSVSGAVSGIVNEEPSNDDSSSFREADDLVDGQESMRSSAGATEVELMRRHLPQRSGVR
jgi:hypothetical protein